MNAPCLCVSYEEACKERDVARKERDALTLRIRAITTILHEGRDRSDASHTTYLQHDLLLTAVARSYVDDGTAHAGMDHGQTLSELVPVAVKEIKALQKCLSDISALVLDRETGGLHGNQQ